MRATRQRDSTCAVFIARRYFGESILSNNNFKGCQENPYFKVVIVVVDLIDVIRGVHLQNSAKFITYLLSRNNPIVLQVDFVFIWSNLQVQYAYGLQKIL